MRTELQTGSKIKAMENSVLASDAQSGRQREAAANSCREEQSVAERATADETTGRTKHPVQEYVSRTHGPRTQIFNRKREQATKAKKLKPKRRHRLPLHDRIRQRLT
jgi:hypothetical protein